MKLAFLGNITVDFLARDFARKGYEVYVEPGFNAWKQALLDKHGSLAAFPADAVILLLDPAAEGYDKNPSVSFGVTRLLIPDIGALEKEISDFRDGRFSAMGLPFSLDGLAAIEEEIEWMLKASPRKVLALDADDTLWNGVVAEDGWDGVKPYSALQEGLLALGKSGTVLALASMNDSPNGGVTPIERAFAREDMPLSLGDFSAVGVNWNPKSGNLKEMCAKLRLATDSVVFVDDNPVHREEVKSALPETVVIAPPSCDSEVKTWLRRVERCFFSDVGKTAEDALRNADYRADALRKRERENVSSLEEYLDSLEIRGRFRLAEEKDIPRLSQMSGKTNQFNSTTIRLGEERFREMLEDGDMRIYCLEAADKFADQGLVAYATVRISCERAVVESFVMSCRAMGRTLENYFLNEVVRELSEKGIGLERIDYVPSQKNAPFKAFLDSLDSTFLSPSRVISSRGMGDSLQFRKSRHLL